MQMDWFYSRKKNSFLMVVQSRDIPTLHNLAPRPRHLLMVISQIIHGFGWSIHDIGELLLVNICQIRHNHICRICRESGFQCSTPHVTHVTPNTCNLKCITTSLLWGHMIQFLLASNLAPKISTISKQSIASHLEKLNKNSKMSGLTLIPDNMSICGIFCCLPFMFSLSIPTTSCGKKNRSRVLLMKLEDAAEVESPAFLNSSLAFFSASPWRMLESEMKKKKM